MTVKVTLESFLSKSSCLSPAISSVSLMTLSSDIERTKKYMKHSLGLIPDVRRLSDWQVVKKMAMTVVGRMTSEVIIRISVKKDKALCQVSCVTFNIDNIDKRKVK